MTVLEVILLMAVSNLVGVVTPFIVAYFWSKRRNQ